MTIETAIKKYAEQRELIKSQLLYKEKIAHCIDKDSCNGKYYFPGWVITSKGRIWSLSQKKWNRLSFIKTPDHTYMYVGGTDIEINELVANYFGCSNITVHEMMKLYYSKH